MVKVPGLATGLGSGFAPANQKPIPTRPEMPPPQRFNSVPEVVRAYRDGKITYNAAVDILIQQFGFSLTDAEDALIIEPIFEPEPEPPIGPPVLPGDFDGDGVPDEIDPHPADPLPEGGRPEPEAEAEPKPEPEPFLGGEFALVGLIAIAGLAWLVFSKEGAASGA